jgi:hypothetical protein
MSGVEELLLLYLKAPSNIDKRVRELQTALYRNGGFISALALPIMIPLYFLSPQYIDSRPAELQATLRRAVGKQAPLFHSGSLQERDGYLFWNLEPSKELERLERNCRRVFTPQDPQQRERRRHSASELFPTARGFFLCFLEGRGSSRFPLPASPDPLTFPAKAAILLRLRPLALEGGEVEQGTSDSELRSWWRSIYWEEIARVPLRKRK